MIEQCLLNKNEKATVSKTKKFLNLNKVIEHLGIRDALCSDGANGGAGGAPAPLRP